MYRLVNLYSWPQDPEEFKRYFLEVHMPIAELVPGALRRGYAFFSNIMGDLDCFCVFEADYESEEALKAALATPQAKAAGADVPNYSPDPPRTLLFELSRSDPMNLENLLPAYAPDMRPRYRAQCTGTPDATRLGEELRRDTARQRRGGMKRVLVLSAGCAMLAACSPGIGEQTVLQRAGALPAEAFDHGRWDANLGGAESAQYSSLNQVNRTNVARLEVAWECPTGEGEPPRFNPVIAGGRMYLLDGSGQLVALDPASGAQIWRSALEGRIGARGINYWRSAHGPGERLFVINNGMLRAIDAASGTVIRSFGNGGEIDLRDGLPPDVDRPASPLQTDNPGRLYEDTIIVSLPAGAYDYAASPANIHAYDVVTGALK